MKKEALSKFFDRQKKNMQNHAYTMQKDKYFKSLAQYLVVLKPLKKEVILKEYFSMCVLVYQARSIVFKKWNQGGEPHDQVYELYNHNRSF